MALYITTYIYCAHKANHWGIDSQSIADCLPIIKPSDSIERTLFTTITL